MGGDGAGGKKKRKKEVQRDCGNNTRYLFWLFVLFFVSFSMITYSAATKNTQEINNSYLFCTFLGIITIEKSFPGEYFGCVTENGLSQQSRINI